MRQERLFSDPVPYQRHSATSRGAATAILPALGKLQAAVLAYITRYGALGATDQEIQAGLAMDPSTERPRRVELLRKGLIRQSGERTTRAGRKAAVWVAR